MKIKEIYVEARIVKNLGNYQSFAPTAGIGIELEEGENYKEVYKKAWDIVGEELSKQLSLFEDKPINKGITNL